MNKVIAVMFVTTLVGSAVAIAQDALQISSTGLGAAKIGMNVEDVQKALGRKLTFLPLPEGAGDSQYTCPPATAEGLDGVSFEFREGKLLEATVTNPSITTKSGIRVGDRENNVIKKLKGDPTYSRHEGRHNDAYKYIRVGKFVRTGGTERDPELVGTILEFFSVNGVVKSISAGEAIYFFYDDLCVF